MIRCSHSLTVLVAAIAVGLAAGCGNRPAATSPQSDESAVRTDASESSALAQTRVDTASTDTVVPLPTVPTRALEQFGDKVDLSELPRELIYPRAKKLARYGDYKIANLGPSYNFETTDPLDRVEAHYRRSMAKWTVLQEVRRDTMVWVTYESADKKEVAEYMATRIGNRTALVVIHCRRYAK